LIHLLTGSIGFCRVFWREKKVTINTSKRVVLFDVNPETKKIEMRHFLINLVPSGVSKGVKKLFQHKVTNEIPSLSKYEDISEYIRRETGMTESDAEDEPVSKVKMEHGLVGPRKKVKTQQNAVRLQELGPRLTLDLICVQEGFFQGDDIFGSCESFIPILFLSFSLYLFPSFSLSLFLAIPDPKPLIRPPQGRKDQAKAKERGRIRP